MAADALLRHVPIAEFDFVAFDQVLADIALEPLPPHSSEIIERVLSGLPANHANLPEQFRLARELNASLIDKAPFPALRRLRALGLVCRNSASPLLVAIAERGLLPRLFGEG